MKQVFIIFCLLLTLFSADDVQRVKSIVKDITKLRSDYEDIKIQLKACKLKLKEQEDITLKLNNETKSIIPDVNSYEHFKALSFRLNKKASIYSGADAKELFKWDKGVSFTSKTKAPGWIKITGYFVNRIWTKPKRELWIKDIDAIVKR